MTTEYLCAYCGRSWLLYGLEHNNSMFWVCPECYEFDENKKLAIKWQQKSINYLTRLYDKARQDKQPAIQEKIIDIVDWLLRLKI